MALNYIHLGNLEDAMVEIRRFDNKQKLLTTKYDSQLDYAESELGSGYSNVSVQFQNSAAARYLSMLMYRARGQNDSAEVDRKLLVRAFNEQKSLYNFNIPSCVDEELSVPRGKARLNFICFTGLAPVKVEDVTRIDVGNNVYTKIAVPMMVDRGSMVNSISVDVYDESGNVQTFVEPVPEDRYVEVYVEDEVGDSKDAAETYDYADVEDSADYYMYEGDANSKYAFDKVSAIVAQSYSDRAKEIVQEEMEQSVLSQASKNANSSSSVDDTSSSRSAAARARALAMGVEPVPATSAQSSQPAKQASSTSASSSSGASQTDSAARSSAARERAAAMGIEQTPAQTAPASRQVASTSTPAKTASNAKVQVSDQNHISNAYLEKIESIENIAMDTFAQHSSVIYSRAMIRAIGKTMKTGALSLASELTDDSTLSAVFSVLSFVSQVSDEVTEQADLRTSRFFPANIYVGGITLDPGVYTVVVTFRGYNGQELSADTYYDVNVTAKSVNIVEAMCLK